MTRLFDPTSLGLLFVTALVACRAGEVGRGSAPASASAPGARSETRTTAAEVPSPPLEVPIAARSGSSLSGTARFTELPDGGVAVVVDVAGVSPGLHGVHVHENADCSAHDASSAGEHYDPDGHPHALPPDEPRHIGDLGNIRVGADGTGHLHTIARRANMRPGDEHSFLGRAIVVHAEPDDGSQPSGGAGARIGCGEIRRGDDGARAAARTPSGGG